MSGIKLKFNEIGDADVIPWRPEEIRYDCIIEDCEYAEQNWICGYTRSSIWDHWRDPGWCPLFKWYRGYKYRDMTKAMETGITFKGFERRNNEKRIGRTRKNSNGAKNQEQNKDD